MKPTPISKQPSQKILKRVVIREELVAITGNFRRALILGQMLYWSERCGEYNQLLEEENSRRLHDGDEQIPYSEGWIYKTSKQLLGELMLDCTPETLRKEMKWLSDKGYLQTRHNPKFKWDRTLQYRVDLIFLSIALRKNGYPLDGYRFANLGNHPDVECIPIQLESSPHTLEAIPENIKAKNTCTESTVRNNEQGLIHYDTSKDFERIGNVIQGDSYNNDPVDDIDPEWEST